MELWLCHPERSEGSPDDVGDSSFATPALAGGAREFSVRYGTALYRLKTPARRVGEVLSALAEGLSVGAAVRVFGHGEFTIRAWLTRAGLHATSLHERLFQNLKLLHLPWDERCPTTRPSADALWIWLAVDTRTKIIAVLKVGPRTQPMAPAVVHALVKVLAPDGLPVFTSDGLKLSFYSLTAHFGSWAETLGRQTHQWQVHAEPPMASTDNSPNLTTADA